MSLFRNIEFLTTVADARTLPTARGAEVAFVGRSNAGKSSAINALANRKRMAFVSKTPGRTQHINFFAVGPDQFLVDLPGYGYAAVPAAERDRWNELIGGYLQSRQSLRGVVLIMDARHPLGVLDYQLLDWLKLLMAEDIPPEALTSRDQHKIIPPLHGALLKNEQDVHLFERLVFMSRRKPG